MEDTHVFTSASENVIACC